MNVRPAITMAHDEHDEPKTTAIHRGHRFIVFLVPRAVNSGMGNP
jgi:hypothetical protein